MEIGTKVGFTKAHHSMNPRLKALVGREGSVGLIGEGANKKVLVSFEALYDSWWISPRLLTPREPDSLKAGVLSLPAVVKSESNLPA